MADHHPTPANPMSPKRVPVHPAAAVSGTAPTASGKASASTVSGKAPVQPVPAQTTSAQTTSAQPTSAQPAAAQPTTGQPAVRQQPIAGQPIAGQPVTGQPIAGQPVAGQPVAGQASVPVRRLPTNAVPSPSFVLQPMIHVSDMAASVAFYEQLGGSVIHGGRDAEWVLMQLGTTQIVLLARPPRQPDGESTVELNFLCTVPLDRLAQQLHRSGAAAAQLVTDPTFGHQLHVQSPDGLLIRINEVDPDPLV